MISWGFQGTYTPVIKHSNLGHPLNEGLQFAGKIINVGTRLVGWYSIVAIVFLLIQFHDVWGRASIVASCFQIFYLIWFAFF